MNIVLTFLYCILAGVGTALVLRRTFAESLAPAFMLHILILILSAIAFGSLNAGIVIGVIVFALFLAYGLKTSGKGGLSGVFNNTGFLVFLLIFAFVAFSNEGKVFRSFDEFSGYGVFLKETLRLDKLFCVSTKEFSHKDYQPALTVFEAMWARMSFRYDESDAFRAIQMLEFSLLMPVISYHGGYGPLFSKKEGKGCAFDLKGTAYSLLKLVLFAVVPLLLLAGPQFYHSIYQDFTVSIIAFYCLFIADTETEDGKYAGFVLSLAFTVLAMQKMTSFMFIPAIVVFYAIRLNMNRKEGKNWIRALIPAGFAVASWYCVNLYIKHFVDVKGSAQSYSGVWFENFLNVFKNDGSIPYQEFVTYEFIYSVLKTPILGGMSYLAALGVSIALFLVTALAIRKKKEAGNVVLITAWVAIMSLIYAVMLWVLYLTVFSESEAISLASYPRYMNTVTLLAVYLAFHVLCRYLDKWKYPMFGALLIASAAILFLIYPDKMKQLKPGKYTDDRELLAWRLAEAAPVNENTFNSPDTKVYCLLCGVNAATYHHLNYDVDGRSLGWGAVGPKRSDNDLWSRDVTPEEFVEEVSRYDFIYFAVVDDAFRAKYSQCFAEPEKLPDGVCVKHVSVNDGKIVLDNG